jgi:protein phosphatase-4 regulatory subunit 3
MIPCATVIAFLCLQFDASQKSDETNPKWFMVDVKFISRAAHFVPYPLLREIAAGRVTQSAGIEYIGEEGLREIKGNFMCHNSLKQVAIIAIQTWIWFTADV